MIEIALAFMAGLLIGSFLNVCVFRLPRDLSVIKPARSFCPFCEETIAWYDNIPVLSYLLLRAKCRHCGAHIPLRYPSGRAGHRHRLRDLRRGASASRRWRSNTRSFSAIMITLIASDFEERILPDEFTVGGARDRTRLSVVRPDARRVRRCSSCRTRGGRDGFRWAKR